MNLPKKVVNGIEECREYCDDHFKCFGFTYVTNAYKNTQMHGKCFLKDGNALQNVTHVPGLKSGLKSGTKGTYYTRLVILLS